MVTVQARTVEMNESGYTLQEGCQRGKERKDRQEGERVDGRGDRGGGERGGLDPVHMSPSVWVQAHRDPLFPPVSKVFFLNVQSTTWAHSTQPRATSWPT